jgi:UTP--glucose-1-phosphate uridylyltransferase
MKITKAVITAAGKSQRKLPVQTLIDRDGNQKSVLEILVEEALDSGIESVCIIVYPGDEDKYKDVLGDYARQTTFIPQSEPLGYGHAIYCAKGFTGNDPFLHLVGDHLYVHRSKEACAQHLVKVAQDEECAVSAVHAARESVMPHYGVIGGQRIPATLGLYRIEKVIEKPTPTLAEQQLQISGLRSGHYLCFFGMHVLTPTVMDILGRRLESLEEGEKVTLSEALNTLAGKEKYLALEKQDWRYDVGTKYGLLKAQLALALSGSDRDEVLTEILELFTSRELSNIGR